MLALQVLLPSSGAELPHHAWANRDAVATLGAPLFDEAVLVSACTQLRAWRNAGFEVSLCVPVSVESLARPETAQEWLRVMSDEGVRSGLIDFGLTPLSGKLGPVVAANITALVDAGAAFSLLGFGSGFSSLSAVKQLPISRLEVCAEHVRDLELDSDTLHVVKGMFEMAKALGIAACAEAVDSAELAVQIFALGAEQYRGRGVSAPLTGAEVPAWVLRENGRWFQPTAPTSQPDPASFPAPRQGETVGGVWHRLMSRLLAKSDRR